MSCYYGGFSFTNDFKEVFSKVVDAKIEGRDFIVSFCEHNTDLLTIEEAKSLNLEKGIFETT